MNYTFEQIVPILKTINNAGYVAYLTGGSVRDYLLYHNFGDIDIASDATPAELSTIFNITRYDKFAAKFGTFKAIIEGKSVEITTFRVEGNYEKYRHPGQITFVSDSKLDSYRRDFTINALYMDQFGKILDYHNGLQDINAKIIRAIGDPYARLQEDPVRILRALRFMLVLNFELDPNLEKSIHELADLVDNISLERQKIELQKLLKIASLQELQKVFDKYEIDVATKM